MPAASVGNVNKNFNSKKSKEREDTMNSSNSKMKKDVKDEQDLEYSEKLKIIDDELMSLYQFCVQSGFSEREMQEICAPLDGVMRQVFLRRLGIGVLVGLALLLGGYWLLSFASVTAHAAALGRIFLIKLLPFWDWTWLFYENCLVSNPFHDEMPTSNEHHCLACETLDTVDRVTHMTYDSWLDGYVSRDAPVIVLDALDHWPVMNTEHFWFDNITNLYLEDDRLQDTVPCILQTNLRFGSSSLDLWTLLRRLRSPNLAKWFVHWQNCDINAVKALRRFYLRPYFLANVVSAAHFNWVFMSSDYNTHNFKKVELDAGLIMLAQLRGSSEYKLTAIHPCNTTCPELSGQLLEGELLVFTNFIWTFEYLPGHSTDNVAILTETVWEDTIA